jgi:hypothetical protein
MLNKKNAYNSKYRNNNSSLSILIACDYDFFINTYNLGNIHYKINHKAYIKAMANNDKKLINQYL